MTKPVNVDDAYLKFRTQLKSDVLCSSWVKYIVACDRVGHSLEENYSCAPLVLGCSC
jgi:hypothetical protein